MLNDQEYNELADVLGQLGTLEPHGSDAKTVPTQALARLKRSAKRSFPLVWKAIPQSGRYAVLTGMALLLAAIFLLPSTQALATNFLALFRVEKFAPIAVSPAQLAKLDALGDSTLFPGEIRMLTEGENTMRFSSVAEAEEHTLTLDAPTLVTSIYSLGEPDSIRLDGGAEAEIDINLAGARAILEATGGDPMTLPDRLDGKIIRVETYEQLTQQWYAADVELHQMVSPAIGYPDGVDPAVIGEAILQFLGMGPAEAYRLARNIDWVTTLVLPIPKEFGSFSEVLIGDTTGLAIQPAGSPTVTLVWQEGGKVYVLTSYGEDGSIQYLLDLVENGEFR